MPTSTLNLGSLVLAIIPLFFSFSLLRDDSALFPSEALPTSSGYLPLRRSSSSSAVKMFYAFYEATDPEKALSETPIILWLQGGPGCSSMTGNFYELGPWTILRDLRLHRNEASWNHRFGVLFIDNPVGSGYSIADKDSDIPTDQEEVSKDLYEALYMFFALNPSFGNRPFYISGESYAGKYVPALGHLMMRSLEGSKSFLEPGGRPLRLDGLIIGNGLTHPIEQVKTHAQTAYSFGLIDSQLKALTDEKANDVVKLVNEEDWQAAHLSRTKLLDWLENVTGIATVLDIRRSVPYHHRDDGTEFLHLFLNKREVKKALGADEEANWIHCSPRVRKIMSNDTMKSVKWMVEDLLVKFPILLYQGQYDIKDGVVSSEEWMKTLKWKGKEEFYKTERKLWSVNGAVAGYWRNYTTLTHVVVRGAGHQVPADQGRSSQDMIETWIKQQL